MALPTRIANEPRSFAPHLLLTGGAAKTAVSIKTVSKQARPFQFGDLTRNLTALTKV